MRLKRDQIDELLARSGIARSLGLRGTRRGKSGTLASVYVDGGCTPNPVMSVVIGGVLARARCPLSPENARAVVDAFRSSSVLPGDASFEHMLVRLLVKISAMFVESGAERLSIQKLHLHPAAYEIEGIAMERPSKSPVRPRLARDAHDRRAAFSHRHGENANFPR